MKKVCVVLLGVSMGALWWGPASAAGNWDYAADVLSGTVEVGVPWGPHPFAVDAGGNVYVIATRGDGFAPDVVVAKWNANTWPPQQVSEQVISYGSEECGRSSCPSIVVDAAGVVHAAWCSNVKVYCPTHSTMANADRFYHAVMNSDGSWTSEGFAESVRSCDGNVGTTSLNMVSLAADPNDGVHIVYSGHYEFPGSYSPDGLFGGAFIAHRLYSGGSYNLCGGIYLTGENGPTGVYMPGWVEYRNIHNDVCNPGIFNPQVAVGPGEHIHVAWWWNDDYPDQPAEHLLKHTVYDPDLEEWTASSGLPQLMQPESQDVYNYYITCDSQDNLHLALSDRGNYWETGSVSYAVFDMSQEAWGDKVEMDPPAGYEFDVNRVSVVNDAEDNILLVASATLHAEPEQGQIPGQIDVVARKYYAAQQEWTGWLILPAPTDVINPYLDTLPYILMRSPQDIALLSAECDGGWGNYRFRYRSIGLKRFPEGWNLISFPFPLSDGRASAVFTAWWPMSDLDYSLMRWDNLSQSLVTYDALDPDTADAMFGDIRLGEGYWFHTTGHAYREVPYPPTACQDSEFAIAIAKTGRAIIGCPYRESVGWQNVAVTREYGDGSSERRTMYDASQYGVGWLYSVAYWWDAGTQSLVDMGLWDDLPTTDSLEPWYGYWVQTMVDDLTLGVPTPQ